MTTRPLVDPDLAPLLDLFPPVVLSHAALPQLWASLADMARQRAAGAPAVPDIAL